MPAFQTAKYQTDAGTIVRIRISESTATVAGNGEPAGALTDGRLFAYASNPGSRRGNQLNARGLRLERFLGIGINRKRLTTFLPVLTPAGLATFTDGAALVIGGETYAIASKIGES
jgi:hypothetical protein